MKKFFNSIKLFITNIVSHDIFTRSAALAYYLIFSIFPAMLLLYSILGFFDIDWNGFLNDIRKFLPEDVFNLFSSYMEYIVPKNDMMFFLTGLFTSLYSSYKAVKCIRTGLNLAYESLKVRSKLQEFFRSLLFTVLLYVAITITLIVVPILSGVLEIFASNLALSKFSILFWNLLKNFLSVVPFLLCLLFLYYLSPGKKIHFLTVLPGALLATTGISLLSSVLGFLTINAVKYSNTYGSLATLIVFILWLYLVSAIILIGGEVSAAISKIDQNNND